MTLPKQNVAFPEVAIIRKGSPKRRNPNKKEQWIQGMDLNAKFRIAFAPGTEDVRQAFAALYPQSIKHYGPDFAEPDGFEMSKLRCMITTRNVADAWEWANEAYNAGRLIARADDTHFITLRDPLNGEYTVSNGEPFTEFAHGQSIVYERDGRKFTLPIRTYGRLSLFLPELKRMVRFTLKTTSFYDRLNISSNLAAIQFLADTLNNGNAAGIPFFIYRREQEITWNKPDGSAARIKKWLVCIEADPAWVEATLKRMSNFSLGGDVLSQALLPPPITGEVNPDDAEDEAEPTQELEYVDVTESIQEPEHAAVAETKKEPEPVADNKPMNGAPRPYTAPNFKAAIEKQVKNYTNLKTPATEKQRNLVAMLLDVALMDEGKDARHSLTNWLFGKPSLKDMSNAEINALLKWLDPKPMSGGDFKPGQYVTVEAKSGYRQALIDEGQTELPL